MTAEQLRMSIINEAFKGDWEIVSLGEVCAHENGDRGKNYPSKDKLGHEGIPFISALNLANNTIKNDDRLLKASEVQFNNLRSGHLKKGDFVVCIRGSIGKHGIYPFEKGAIASSLVILRPDENKLNLMWLSYYFDSGLFQDSLSESQNGTAQPNLGAKDLMKFEIPLPPLAEQKRIVAKLEELLPIVEQYGKAQKELDELNAALPARLRQSILQEAISGKLVPQDENDEPASVLLQHIREEKERLVKAKQISKRDFEVLPITEDDVDFDIPVTWEWVRLGDIFKHSTGKALNEANKKGCLHDYITTSNVYWGYFKLDKLRQMYYTEDEKEKCMATKGDLLVLEGGDVGRAAIWDKDYDIFLQNHIHKLRAYIPVCTKFYYYCLYLFHDMGLVGGKGIGIQGLSSGALHQIIFPLPPLAEQERIVAKIEELFAEIDKLK